MTPTGYYNPFGGAGWGGFAFAVYSNGIIDDYNVADVYALRPVINIRRDVTVSGLGTMENPYTFSQEECQTVRLRALPCAFKAGGSGRSLLHSEIK